MQCGGDKIQYIMQDMIRSYLDKNNMGTFWFADGCLIARLGAGDDFWVGFRWFSVG